MNLVKLGDYTAPKPTKYGLEVQDIDSADTGRGETGHMHRERVREGVYKLSLSFTNLTSNEVLAIKNAITPDSISVTLFDGSYVTKNMYAGARTLDLKSIDDNSNCFWDMTFNLTEF